MDITDMDVTTDHGVMLAVEALAEKETAYRNAVAARDKLKEKVAVMRRQRCVDIAHIMSGRVPGVCGDIAAQLRVSIPRVSQLARRGRDHVAAIAQKRHYKAFLTGDEVVVRCTDDLEGSNEVVSAAEMTVNEHVNAEAALESRGWQMMEPWKTWTGETSTARVKFSPLV